MPEVVDFLMLESGKHEHLIEEALKYDPNAGCAIEDLQRIVQNTFKLYSSVEKLRESYSNWVMIHSNRVYDSIKGLISLNCLPEPNLFPGLPKNSKEAMVAGYLYVFHVFQIHTHALGNIIRSFEDLDGSLHRLFCSTQQDLIIRRQFLERIRCEFNSSDREDLATGVELAFEEIGALLLKKSQY